MTDYSKILEKYDIMFIGGIMYITREYYFNKLLKMQNTNNIKVIIGIRRSGKSVLLKLLYDHYRKKQNCIYLNLEDYNNIELHNPKQLHQYIEKNVKSKEDFIFIDEIQYVKDFELVVNSIRLMCNNIYITGSNASMLNGNLSTVLSGRYVTLQVYPFTYRESLLINKDNTVDHYLLNGGMPTVSFVEEDLQRDYIKNLIDTILYNDVLSYNTNIEPELLNRIVTYTINNISTEISAKNLTNFLITNDYKVTVTKVYEILNSLEEAFFITKVKRYNIIGKQILKNSGKYYLTDLVFKKTLSKDITDIGRVIENVVYNELKYRGYEIFVGKNKNLEVDFVALKDSETVYIQVTYLLEGDVDTKEREQKSLLKINDNHKKIIISHDQFKVTLDNGLKHILLSDFLNGDEL